eukprot:Em0006g1465a
MLSFKTCEKAPVRGGRGGVGGGGLVEVEGRVVWGGGFGGGVYMYEEDRWSRVAEGGEKGGTLAVCGGRLVWVGGLKGSGVWSKEVKELRGGRWSVMPDMLVGCEWSCVVSVSGGGMVVMGGYGDGARLNDVQVFDGGTQTWHRGPSLPKPCHSMSAVVHGDVVFVIGGVGMDRAVWCADIRDLQSVWREVPDVPTERSSVCVVDGVLLAIGGDCTEDGSKKASSIYGLHLDEEWRHVGDLPFACSTVDTLLLSGGGLFMVNGYTEQVMKITVQGLAKLFPIIPILKVSDKSQKEAESQKEADERRLYEEAMTKGYVETSVTKCLILGAAGVGKTHLKHLLLKKDPPQQRVSTGLADNPVRAISFSLAGVSVQEEDDWFVVEDDQALLKVVGGTIRDGGVSMATSLDKVVGSFPKMAIHVSSDGAGADPTPTAVSVTTDTSHQSRTVSIEKELIHHINHSSGKEKLFGVKWIQFIDSGGQLQYHDILPLFVQNPGVAIFVLNLSEKLSHQPAIEYYGADGKPVGKAYQSSLSHQQILQHCLGAMCSQDVHPLIITVGTHRDAADRCSESIKEKNQELMKLLAADRFCVLCNGEELTEAIFPVNGKTPGVEDRHVATVLRQKIVSMCPKLIKMPIAWFGLEVLLQRSSHGGILSIVECQVCAKSLHLEGDAFFAALHHLVHHNMFLHYPEALPQTVFCDPQVVLTKVTELVEYHHKLRDCPDKGVAAERGLAKFRDHGLLSVELLNKFSKHYTEGLFTPHDLLKLLVSVGAIAMIGEGGVYLMPGLLPHLDSGQVSMYYQQGASLVIRPTQGCIPSGLFCCLVAHLLSPTNQSSWKVCMEGDKPLCLYRNCITFELKHTTELVTLVDMFSYILLHVDEMSCQVCREIRCSVHSGIKSACGILKYQGVQFEDAFMCPGASCISDPPHVAVVVSEKRWVCSSRGRQKGDLSEGQLMWFGESGGTKQDPSASDPVSLDSEPSLPLLMEKVAAVIPSKCWAIGLQLGLTAAELQAICPQQQGLENYHRAFALVGLLPSSTGGSPPHPALVGLLPIQHCTGGAPPHPALVGLLPIQHWGSPPHPALVGLLPIQHWWVSSPSSTGVVSSPSSTGGSPPIQHCSVRDGSQVLLASERRHHPQILHSWVPLDTHSSRLPSGVPLLDELQAFCFSRSTSASHLRSHDARTLFLDPWVSLNNCHGWIPLLPPNVTDRIRMSILPLTTPPSSYRTKLRSNRFFCLQKKKSSTLMNTLDSLRAAKSSPFRILVQISEADFSYVIAVGTSEQEIEADWAWLEENLLGVLASKHFNPEKMRFQDMEQNIRPPITRGCGHQRVLSSEGVVTRKLECQSNMAAEYITLTTPTKAHQFSMFMNIKETFELMETLTKIAIQDGVPRNIIANSTSPYDVMLSWQPPYPVERNGVTVNYTILLGESPDSEHRTFSSQEPSVSLHSLASRTTCFYSIAAGTIAGTGPFSDFQQVTTLEEAVNISLSLGSYSTYELAGHVEVCARLLIEGLDKSVHVILSTEPGTAIGDVNFIPLHNHYFHFSPGMHRDETQCVNMTVLDDGVVKDDEELYAVLSTDDPSVGLKEPYRAVITLINSNYVSVSLKDSIYYTTKATGYTQICALLMEDLILLFARQEYFTKGTEYTPLHSYPLLFSRGHQENDSLCVAIGIQHNNCTTGTVSFGVLLLDTTGVVERAVIRIEDIDELALKVQSYDESAHDETGLSNEEASTVPVTTGVVGALVFAAAIASVIIVMVIMKRRKGSKKLLLVSSETATHPTDTSCAVVSNIGEGDSPPSCEDSAASSAVQHNDTDALIASTAM